MQHLLLISSTALRADFIDGAGHALQTLEMIELFALCQRQVIFTGLDLLESRGKLITTQTELFVLVEASRLLQRWQSFGKRPAALVEHQLEGW